MLPKHTNSLIINIILFENDSLLGTKAERSEIFSDLLLFKVVKILSGPAYKLEG